MYKKVLYLVFILGSLLHAGFMFLNTVLKEADSFAYLQMASYLEDFSLSGLGTGWFGFLYSLPIAILNFVLSKIPLIPTSDSLFLSAQIVNLGLCILSGFLLFKLGRKYLNKPYSVLLIILFFLSPTLLDYNIRILSENLYIPLFLGFFLAIQKLMEEASLKNGYVKVGHINVEVNNKLDVVKAGILTCFLLGLLYITRSEAFIYLAGVILCIFYLGVKGEISLNKFFGITLLLIVSFMVIISPYVYYLHTITGDWGLTNKGASNIRQAEMRGIETMDDMGFEQAVGELTADKAHLKAGFVGGLKYEAAETTTSVLDFLLVDPKATGERILENQKKLYTETIPGLFIGWGLKAYNDESFFFYQNKFIVVLLSFPLFLGLYGVYHMLTNKIVRLSSQRSLIIVSIALFLVASVFFTLFFVLDRYFIVFLPIGLLFICIGAEHIWPDVSDVGSTIVYLILSTIIIFTFSLGLWQLYTVKSPEDERYSLKQEAGLWLQENAQTELSIAPADLKVMERFPITTYYSGTKERWLTPYTDKITDLIKYARANGIDILVADTYDFKTYRPKLEFLLDEKENHYGLQVLKTFQQPGKKVILYKVTNEQANNALKNALFKK